MIFSRKEPTIEGFYDDTNIGGRYPLGYSLLNIMSMNLEEIMCLINNFDYYINQEINMTKAEKAKFGINSTDDIYILHSHTIFDQFMLDREKFISELLLIKFYFDICEKNNFEFTLDNFLNFIGLNKLKLPYTAKYLVDIVSDYDYDVISFDNYYKNLDLISATFCSSLEDDVGQDFPSYTCDNFLDVCIVIIYHILSSGYKIKKCANCQKYFVPYNRSDTLYCERISPKDKSKNCKQYATYNNYLLKTQNDKAMKLYKQIYNIKRNKANRCSDEKFKKDLYDFMRKADEYKKNIKLGIKTEQEYLEWLKAVKGNKGDEKNG